RRGGGHHRRGRTGRRGGLVHGGIRLAACQQGSSQHTGQNNSSQFVHHCNQPSFPSRGTQSAPQGVLWYSILLHCPPSYPVLRLPPGISRRSRTAAAAPRRRVCPHYTPAGRKKQAWFFAPTPLPRRMVSGTIER